MMAKPSDESALYQRYGQPGGKILINLSNLLLCEALVRFLTQEIKECQVVAANCADEEGGFPPVKVIVDGRTIRCNPASRWPRAKIILLDTGLEEEEVIGLLLHYRLDGIIRADTDLRLFKKALKTIDDGQIWLDNGRVRAILNHAESLASFHQETDFSKREREIITLVSQGCRNREIAGMLNISEQTVKTHISRIFRKTSISSRSQLVPLALKLKLPAME